MLADIVASQTSSTNALRTKSEPVLRLSSVRGMRYDRMLRATVVPLSMNVQSKSIYRTGGVGYALNMETAQ